MKYIFVAGAPGSKWSSVVKNIYYSPDVDQTDYSDARTYYHDASGETQLMHLGVYFDPGMEFGHMLDTIDQYTKEELEAEFDRPFSGSGVRIIKLEFEDDALDYIVDQAIVFNLGARGLRSICEAILTDAMFELPSDKSIKSFNVSKDYAQRKFEHSTFYEVKLVA